MSSSLEERHFRMCGRVSIPYPRAYHNTNCSASGRPALRAGISPARMDTLDRVATNVLPFLYRIPPVLGPRPVSSRVSSATLTGSGDSAPSLIPVLWTSSIGGPYRRRIEVGSSQVVARSLKESLGLQRLSVGWENQRMQWRSLSNLSLIHI